jgi:hypothetical protein
MGATTLLLRLAFVSIALEAARGQGDCKAADGKPGEPARTSRGHSRILNMFVG